MNDIIIVSKINEYLHIATQKLSDWLGQMLPRVADDWWDECVINNLSYAQREIAAEKNFTKLEHLDLAALLRVTYKSWYDMRNFAYLPTSERECVSNMIGVRNNWAHCRVEIPDKDIIIHDIKVIKQFLEQLNCPMSLISDIESFETSIETSNFANITIKDTADNYSEVIEPVDSANEIKERDQVIINGDPDARGMVFSVSEVNGLKKYEVFFNGSIQTFFEGQISPVSVATSYNWVDISTFQSYLTSYQINNPSAGNLYSLNSARIDFVPYQFRPALKMIKSDEPRILIADSVGVGKTIEAGLIIKELEARSELDNVLIICPKPLVSERKWELEMKRFDEDFVPLNGAELRQIISDTDRDGEWPTRYNKSIIPYSILDSRVYEGECEKKSKTFGLLDLDPAPHFDLVIIDEAHHIRNGSLDKEKAFAYKCVRYFCEHADAVVMLTATPLQTSDDDLFTLLNLLRPDVVMDKSVFALMSRPNEFVSRCSHIVRGAADGWQDNAIDELNGIATTQWGENVICKNPLYSDIIERLQAPEISREERVKLVSDIESLHSFNTMINRTRRKDIQDFCIRRSYTVETEFTPAQEVLHNKLLEFEYLALSQLHNVRSIPFMMSTIRRQAASCIFGLAPHIKDIIDRRFAQISDDPFLDIDNIQLDNSSTSVLLSLARDVINTAENLPDDDPKFDSVLNIINEKQKEENNKIILFSTFRHTLHYVKRRLIDEGIRVAQIDGSVDDESRRELRKRFEMAKNEPEAIDILLFTEVGSEGLDYQFCDTMINYDLPWNPMRIEQRIGRIDRRGQKSEAVSIYNIITAGTVDADIYNRCLMRIGIFERSIGECEEVLGEIGLQIEKIALNTELTDEERKYKLEQMADNEVRRMQELSKLEDEERQLFGFDLSNYTASKEIRDAESPWITPANLQKLVERYLNSRLGNGTYFIGDSGLKRIRLSKTAREALREDFRKLSDVKSGLKRKWELYLKGSEPTHTVTFLSEIAEKERNAFFITPQHPLIRQAAQYFASDETAYINLVYYSNNLPEGTYPFSIYAWNYVGLNPKFKVVPVCDNSYVEKELTDILQEAKTLSAPASFDKKIWTLLEDRHVARWLEAKNEHIASAQSIANFKLESIGSNFRNRRRGLEQKILDAFDENIKRMYQSELDNATENYEKKVADIEQSTLRADIHTTLIANGIIEIKRE